MFATSLALIGQEFHGKDRATAFGVWGATIGGAVAIGPLVGGVITEHLGWEWIFFVNVPIGIAAIVLTERKIANVAAQDPEPIDVPGLVTFSLALFLLIFGLIRGNPEGWGSPLILACLIGAAALLLAFVAIERRSDHPMLDLTPVPQTGLQRRLGGRLLPLGRDVRDVPLPDDLHAGRARLLAAGGGPALPAADRASLRRRADRRRALATGSRSASCSAPGWPSVGVGLLLMHGVVAGLGAGRRCSPASSSPAIGIGITNPGIGQAAIAVVPVEKSGMGSGINTTFRQVGIATGVAGARRGLPVAGRLEARRAAAARARRARRTGRLGRLAGGRRRSLPPAIARRGRRTPPTSPSSAASTRSS